MALKAPPVWTSFRDLQNLQSPEPTATHPAAASTAAAGGSFPAGRGSFRNCPALPTDGVGCTSARGGNPRQTCTFPELRSLWACGGWILSVWIRRSTGGSVVCNKLCIRQSWALPVFFHFFNNQKLFFCTFYKVNNLLLHQSYLKSP